MEDVLAVYAHPFDPSRPVVCPDETGRPLLGEARDPMPAFPGQPARHGPACLRNGMANGFPVTEPLRGWRAATVSDQRTRLDFAARAQALDAHEPEAERIVVALDRLNTHAPASLYAAFPAAETKRLADKPEIRHTPKHGSRLKMAEPELSALQRRCLRPRLPDRAAMARDVSACADRRNAQTRRIERQLTTADARTKPRRLYPAFEA